MQANNLIDVSVTQMFTNKESWVNVIINIIISIYTIIMTVICIYYFHTGESKYNYVTEVNDLEEKYYSKITKENSEKIEQRHKGMCYLLLALFGCIFMTLRSLFNNDLLSKIGIVVIIFLIIICYKYEFAFINTKPTNKTIDYLFGKNSTSLMERIIFAIWYEVDIIPKKDLDFQNTITNEQNSITNKLFIEIPNMIISSICILINISMLLKNKIGLNLRSVNTVITSILFVFSLIYLVINLLRDKPIELLFYVEDKKQFYYNNKSFLQDTIYAYAIDQLAK